MPQLSKSVIVDTIVCKEVQHETSIPVRNDGALVVDGVRGREQPQRICFQRPHQTHRHCLQISHLRLLW